MKQLIERIDKAPDSFVVTNLLATSVKQWIDGLLTDKELNYIKGYADCKIKQLGKN